MYLFAVVVDLSCMHKVHELYTDGYVNIWNKELYRLDNLQLLLIVGKSRLIK